MHLHIVCGKPRPVGSLAWLSRSSLSVRRPQDIRPPRLAMASSDTAHTFTNRLSSEASPYLKQHMHNPVDWYPWGSEAFQRAQAEDKPIFLSIGYSTCHWCHVMEHESFSNEDVAKIMNENFINVKVDREERPDVDKVYMTYVQAASGGGGWPMSCFLTPDLHPFVAGTYFPPEDQYGRAGFKTVMQKVRAAWDNDRDNIVQSSAQVMQQLASFTASEGGAAVEAKQARQALTGCTDMLAERFDTERGGFGSAPKFPRPSEINALFAQYLATKVPQYSGRDLREMQAEGNASDSQTALFMALFTLLRMAAGGMYDQIGGGFHRYSVDEFWHVPHFEKMMYDNGLLASSYVTAYKITRDARYAATARGVLDYVLRDMIHEQGGVFSAEDADSVDFRDGAKKEGAFYIWTKEEVDAALPEASAADFCTRYMVRPGGNCILSQRSDPHNEFVGKNCLLDTHSADAAADTAAATAEALANASQTTPPVPAAAGDTTRETAPAMAAAREMLHRLRADRPRPSLDNKILAAWNGMAISALVQAAMVLPPAEADFPVDGEPASRYLHAAERAAHFVRARLYNAGGKRLYRSWCDGVLSGGGFADDYAWMICASLDLFEATGAVNWLTWASEMQASMDELFWDEGSGGYFQTGVSDDSILLRMKEDYDGAEPSASAIAARNLLRLHALLPASEGGSLLDRAAGTVSAFSKRLHDIPLAMPELVCSAQLVARGPCAQIVVAMHGDGAADELLRTAHSLPDLHRIIIPVDTGDEAQLEHWKSSQPHIYELVVKSSKSAAFVCRDFACQQPTSDVVELQRLLVAPSQQSKYKMEPFDLTAFGKPPPE